MRCSVADAVNVSICKTRYSLEALLWPIAAAVLIFYSILLLAIIIVVMCLPVIALLVDKAAAVRLQSLCLSLASAPSFCCVSCIVFFFLFYSVVYLLVKLSAPICSSNWQCIERSWRCFCCLPVVLCIL